MKKTFPYLRSQLKELAKEYIRQQIRKNDDYDTTVMTLDNIY